MVFCIRCGFEIVVDNVNSCPKCGTAEFRTPTIDSGINYTSKNSTMSTKSKWWYLLPIFFSILGGLISYFILRKADPKLAKNCLLVGLMMAAINFLIGSLLGVSLLSF